MVLAAAPCRLRVNPQSLQLHIHPFPCCLPSAMAACGSLMGCGAESSQAHPSRSPPATPSITLARK